MKSYNRKVNYYETDKMGITHHSNYVRYMEEARLDFFSQIGFDYAECEKNGIISPVVSIACNYLKTTTYPDLLEIEVFVEKVSSFKLELGYSFKKGWRRSFYCQ